MSRDYYKYQDVKVRIAHRLMQLDGWKVYGYHADNSDMMTDYYDPAYWDGIAEKNGYKLVVDKPWAEEERRYTIATAEKVSSDAKTREKIAKLEELTQERGATEAEEAAAKRAISALLKKEHEEEEAGTAYKEIIEPGHLANPPRCNWHIEKDGVIIDKGTGILKFCDVPDITQERELKDWQDFNNLSADEWMQKWIDGVQGVYYHEPAERMQEIAQSRYNDAKKSYDLLKKFNILINRFDTTCGGMVGNTDDFYTYEEIAVIEYKKEIKAEETKTGEIKEGQHFIIKSSGFNNGVCSGYVYIIHEKEGVDGRKYYTTVRMNGKHTKELTGTANPANFFCYIFSDKDREKLLKWIDKGAIGWCDLVEVSTPYEVKKVVKKARSATAANPSAQPEQPKEEPGQEPETVRSAETEQAKEAEQAKETEEAAPDMFAEFAAAYIQKKTVKAAPKAEKKPEPEPELAPEPETETEKKTTPEEPPKPGFSGNDNDSGMFTPEDREKLSAGVPVARYRGNYTDIYFSAPYSDGVKLIYSVYSYGKRENIAPGRKAEYYGFLVGSDLYARAGAIAEKFAADVDAKLRELLPDESAAAHCAANVEKWERKDIEKMKEHDYTSSARNLFFDGKCPVLSLFSERIEDADKLISYIQEPEKAVEKCALEYMCAHPAALYKEWIRFNRLSAAFEKINGDPENEEHKLLKLSRSVTDEKTVRIELSNGHEVKAEADAVKYMCRSGYISDWRIVAQDRKYLNKNEYNRPDDIRLADIVAIRHGGRVLYQAKTA